MPLKFKIAADEFGDLDEALQGFYTEQDGEYVLDAEGLPEAEDTSGLKSALQKERESARKFAREKKALEDKYGTLDVEEFERLKAAEQDAETAKLEAAGEWDKIKAQMIEQHGKELGAKDKEIDRLTTQIRHITVDSAATQALADAGGNVELLKPHLMNRVRLNTDDFSVQILEADGTTPKVDASGNPVTIDTLVREMRDSDVFASGFKATAQSGSGSEPTEGGGDQMPGQGKPNGGTPPAGQFKPRSQMTDREKIDAQKQLGIDAYLNLPD
jgi:hypothetical protein